MSSTSVGNPESRPWNNDDAVLSDGTFLSLETITDSQF